MSTVTYPSGAAVVLDADAPSEEWHAIRQTGIGGSDIAAICGLNPYTSALEIWLKKTGTPVPRRDDPVLSEAALMGHALEPVIATRFTAITGLIAHSNPGTLRHPSIPWALVNLDRYTEEDSKHGALELKSRSSYALQEWQAEVPVDVQVQVQWQLAVTGWDFAYTAALIGGQRTIVHRIERDQQLIDDLLVIGEEFWGWVENNQQPPVDGSHATGQLLDRLHAQPSEDIVLADPTEVEQLLRQRATVKEQIQAGELALLDADNRLKHLCGDATEVHIRGERAYSWPAYKRRGGIDWRQLAADHPDVDLDAYRKPDTTYRTLRIHLENL